jgi:uncharacterized membrane protein
MAKRKQTPMDLLLVAVIVLFIDILVLVPVLNGNFLRTYLGILLVLFLPGYALTAAIFPAKKDLEGIERAVISLGLSIALVPTMGFVLNYTTWGIREITLLTGLSVFILLMCAIAYYRRNLLLEEEAFEVPFKAFFLQMKTELMKKPESKIDKIFAVILVLSTVASVVGLAHIIGNPKEREHFTEFYILGANKTADGYPTNLIFGKNATVIVGIVNHENRPVDYTMEMRLENQSLPLPEDQKQISLAHNMSWIEQVTFTPPFKGKNMKLEFLLFNETEKQTPYRNLHLWINVTKET